MEVRSCPLVAGIAWSVMPVAAWLTLASGARCRWSRSRRCPVDLASPSTWRSVHDLPARGARASAVARGLLRRTRIVRAQPGRRRDRGAQALQAVTRRSRWPSVGSSRRSSHHDLEAARAVRAVCPAVRGQPVSQRPCTSPRCTSRARGAEDGERRDRSFGCEGHLLARVVRLGAVVDGALGHVAHVIGEFEHVARTINRDRKAPLHVVRRSGVARPRRRPRLRARGRG